MVEEIHEAKIRGLEPKRGYGVEGKNVDEQPSSEMFVF